MPLSLPPRWQKTAQPNLGFSLIELLIVIGVLAVILAFAVPNMRQMILNNRIKAATDALATALNMARNEAITRKTEIRFCSANADGSGCDKAAAYKHGAILQDGNNVIYRTESLNADITITTTLSNLRIKSSGAPRNSGDLYFFITGKGDINRTICIGAFGQIHIFDGQAVKEQDGTIKHEKAPCRL